MNLRQFLLLFICSLVTWWVGIGLMPLLPIYAAGLGAKPTMVGMFLSFSFFTLALGTATAGWLARKLARRTRLLALLSLIGAVASGLLALATQLWQLVLLVATIWFIGGVSLVLLGVLTGLSATAHARGRVFGWLAASSALAGVIGGLVMGPTAERWGYPVLFGLIALTFLVQLVLAPLIAEPVLPSTPSAQEKHGQKQWRPSRVFVFLLAANVCYSIGTFVAGMGRSLAMDQAGFGIGTISLVAGAGSAVGLVVMPLFGRLSDGGKRLPMLALTYALGALALVGMVYAGSLATFLVVAALMAAAGAERAVAGALVTDLAPPGALDQYMAQFDTVRWAAGIVGFAGAGYGVEVFGLPATLWLGAVLAGASIVLLLVTDRSQRQGAVGSQPVEVF
jgi:MFS transporter, DHA1 family, multidrug resistance protein